MKHWSVPQYRGLWENYAKGKEARPPNVGFHVYEMFEAVKATETERRLVDAEAERRDEWEMIAHGYVVS